MKKILLTLMAIMTVCVIANAQKKEEQSMKTTTKTLVVYFSATGTTAQAAKTIAEAAGGELREIAPQEAYTSADLDWHDKQSRSSVEMKDPKARPAMKKSETDTTNYDIIFIGYPIWWNEAPRIINTFIESLDLKGKIIVPFATSGGSGITNSVNVLKKTYPDLKWEEGRLLNRASRETIQEWVDSLINKKR